MLSVFKGLVSGYEQVSLRLLPGSDNYLPGSLLNKTDSHPHLPDSPKSICLRQPRHLLCHKYK
jgi:hypothetical protein